MMTSICSSSMVVLYGQRLLQLVQHIEKQRNTQRFELQHGIEKISKKTCISYFYTLLLLSLNF